MNDRDHPAARRCATERGGASRIIVGVDTGGTFTDFVALWPDGSCRIHKRASTPGNPAQAVLAGLSEILDGASGAEITYGSTVATNAVLERKGARVAVLTTRGFEDLLEIARQVRPDIYALHPRKPEPLVPARRRFGVVERMTFAGEVAIELEEREIAAAVRAVQRCKAESVAVCLLHSYADPEHERRLATALRAAGCECSVSSELVAEYREYERLSTTVLNAYVAPVVRGHLGDLARGLPADNLRVLQSSGGAISVQTAGREAVRTLLSGPAGGVVGALAAGRRVGATRLITFDMGGTSTDVSLVNGAIHRHTEWAIGDHPVKVPAIDIHTVGAGGGSIARVDAGGVLRVGPESAGAEPGPACYGRGTEPTVTDADLVLGRLPADAVLGGRMTVDPAGASRAIGGVAAALGVGVEEAAEGVVRVVNASMERAMRAISVERGFDPRDYVLVSFGGAAGMHACSLAAGLGMRKVLVPLDPGVLSAWGATAAPIELNYVQTVRLSDPDPTAVQRRFAIMRRRAERDMRREAGVAPTAVVCTVDARYRGQSYEIEVPFSPRYRADFHAAHLQRYGHAEEKQAVEIVNLRVSALVARSAPQSRRSKATARRAAAHRFYWDGRWLSAQHVVRDSLPWNRAMAGPLIVSEISATTLVPPGWKVRVAAPGDLLLETK